MGNENTALIRPHTGRIKHRSRYGQIVLRESDRGPPSFFFSPRDRGVRFIKRETHAQRRSRPGTIGGEYIAVNFEA